MKKLPIVFYQRFNVLDVAQELLGKIIVTNINGIKTTARIVETEAYIGITDKASHSYAGKRTQRNEHMYGPAGISYVYICYGMHYLFNVVTNKKNIPDAVLVRAAEPIEGIEEMLLRTNKTRVDFTLSKGPGNMSKALGINKTHSGISLNGNQIFIADDGYVLSKELVGKSKRIGIDGAGEAKDYPYRFFIRENKYVSGWPRK
jgi:DNA-3-methyladenine glycosylase